MLNVTIGAIVSIIGTSATLELARQILVFILTN